MHSTPARRTGTVLPCLKRAAAARARRQRALLTGDLNGNQYRLPEELETSYEFAPRVDGVVSGMGANVRLTRVSFGFGEVLPWCPAEG